MSTIKIELLNNYLRENKLSKTAFCKLCKISIGTLNKILASGENISILALFKIARVINIHIHELFVN